MSPERLDELEALAAAATPGPWEPKVVSGDAACYHNPGSRLRLNTNQSWAVGPLPHRCGLQAQHDAAFIAAARTAVPELITRVREAQTAAAELERQFDHERTLRRQAEEEVARLRALIAEQDDEDCLCLACGAARIGGTCVRAALAGNCPWGQAAAAHRARVEEVRDDG